MLLRGARAGHPARRERRLTHPPAPRPSTARSSPACCCWSRGTWPLYDPPRVLAWRLSTTRGWQTAAAWLGPLLPGPDGRARPGPGGAAPRRAAPRCSPSPTPASPSPGRGPRPRAARHRRWPRSCLVVLPSAAFVGMGVGHRPALRPGRRGRAAAPGHRQDPRGREPLRRRLLGHDPRGARRGSRASGTSSGATRSCATTRTCRAPTSSCCRSTSPAGPASASSTRARRRCSSTRWWWSSPRACPARTRRRLAAAGVAALNPLVYWHQIFGANDLVFVAMLLGAVLWPRAGEAGARGGRAPRAWPAPPSSWPGPSRPSCWSRCAGPAAFATSLAPGALAAPRSGRLAAAARRVPGWSSLPVAALDFRAFWGDIVVYNVGLPGADNYPLGGTPGFGFANFLIYFGRVADLRDYVPFSVFYLLLVPAGAPARCARSCATGGPECGARHRQHGARGVALLLARRAPELPVPAAVVLPVARARPAARAPTWRSCPLLLLRARRGGGRERGSSAAAWEQAAAADLPGRARGPRRRRSAPGRARISPTDPLGLVFSATAAGLGVLYLALAIGGAPRRAAARRRRARRRPSWSAVPALVLAGIAGRTGVVRAQDPAVVQAQADAGRLLAGRSPYTPPPETTPRGREAARLELPARPAGGDPARAAAAAAGPFACSPASRGSSGVRDLRVRGRAGPRRVGGRGRAPPRGAAAEDGARARAAAGAAGRSGRVLGSPAALALAALVGAWAVAARAAALGRAAGGCSGGARPPRRCWWSPFVLAGAPRAGPPAGGGPAPSSRTCLLVAPGGAARLRLVRRATARRRRPGPRARPRQPPRVSRRRGLRGGARARRARAARVGGRRRSGS